MINRVDIPQDQRAERRAGPLENEQTTRRKYSRRKERTDSSFRAMPQEQFNFATGVSFKLPAWREVYRRDGRCLYLLA